MHHPVGAETGEQDLSMTHARGLRAYQDPIQLALRGAPQVPDNVRWVAQPLRGPEPGQRAFQAQGLGEPPSSAGGPWPC